MVLEILKGIFIPLIGTSLGAACILGMRRSILQIVQGTLMGFAAGVMVAASIWSLLLPALEQSAYLGKASFVPVVLGFWLGILFLMLLEHFVLYFRVCHQTQGAVKSHVKKTILLVLAVVLHNVPEGMAVGAVYAGYLTGNPQITLFDVLALAIGIAIQNFPEGAIVSIPLCAEGVPKGKAFLYGVVSGVVEPLGAVVTIGAARLLVPIIPYLLSFAAGAMMYVVVEELIPEMKQGKQSDSGTIFFAVGFTLMIILDVALG